MRNTLAKLSCAFALVLTGAAVADPGTAGQSQWTGQVESSYVRAEEPFHVVATDDQAWTRTWRFKLDQKPPRALAEGEIGVILVGGPRPTPGYRVRYTLAGESAQTLTIKAWVESPEVVMYPAGSSSHPWRAAIVDSNAASVEVIWQTD